MAAKIVRGTRGIVLIDGNGKPSGIKFYAKNGTKRLDASDKSVRAICATIIAVSILVTGAGSANPIEFATWVIKGIIMK